MDGKEVLACGGKIDLWAHLLCVTHWVVTGVRHVQLAFAKVSVLAPSRPVLLSMTLCPMARLILSHRLLSLHLRLLMLRKFRSGRSLVLRRVNCPEAILGVCSYLRRPGGPCRRHWLLLNIISVQTDVLLAFPTGRSYHDYRLRALLIFHAICLIQISVPILIISTNRRFTWRLHLASWVQELGWQNQTTSGILIVLIRAAQISVKVWFIFNLVICRWVRSFSYQITLHLVDATCCLRVDRLPLVTMTQASWDGWQASASSTTWRLLLS